MFVIFIFTFSIFFCSRINQLYSRTWLNLNRQRLCGYVSGYDEIRKYWTRQWTELNPTVEPIGFNVRQNGTVEVTVHQIVKDLKGNLMFDGAVKHIYIIQDDLLRRIDIELV